jgi:hypothetical protein
MTNKPAYNTTILILALNSLMIGLVEKYMSYVLHCDLFEKHIKH